MHPASEYSAYLSALANPRRQALHDRFADTVVVDVDVRVNR